MSLNSSLSTLLLASACLLAQPNVRDVRNAAGNLNPGLPGYGIAPGSLISIAGSTSSDPQTGTFPLSTSLNGVSVKISSGGQDVDALIVSISTSRILALVPSSTPAGAATVRVSDANGTTALSTRVVDRNFAVFTQPGTSAGAGAAFAVNLSDAGNSANGLTTPAMPGQQIAILGSGAGATTQDETNAVTAEPLAGDFKLYIGGQLAAIVSTGRSGLGVDGLSLPAGLAGLDSIVAMVPAGVSGCKVAVVAVTDGALVSNFATISVSADGTTCSDAGYLSADDINGLPAAGVYNTGVISLSRFNLSLSVPPLGAFDLSFDSASALFQRADVSAYKAAPGGNYTSIGSCVVTFSTPDGSDLDNVALPALLDAGAAINLKGPKGTTVMKRLATGDYQSASATGSSSPFFPPQGTPFAEAGLFTADNANGGADVQGFTANLNNAKPFTWTNQAQISDVTRSEGVTVNWTGGASDGTVVILGTSLGSTKTTASFTCMAPASAGTFRVPAVVTMSLPASISSPSTALGAPAGGGVLMVLASSYSKFTAPGLDQGIFASAIGSQKTVNFK